MARDFEKEIAEATEAGDAARLSRLAYMLLGKLETDDARRAKDARRHRQRRASATSANSADVQGYPQTSTDVADGVPPLTTNSTTTTPTARDAIADLGDVKLQTALDRVTTLMGTQWVDVAEFLLRRPYKTWQGWCDAMLRDVGMASQYTPDDLATVCRDDSTLDKRIGSAGVLRIFLGYARRERMGMNERAPPAGAARSGTTSRRDTKPLKPAGIPAPPSDPDVEPNWQT